MTATLEKQNGELVDLEMDEVIKRILACKHGTPKQKARLILNIEGLKRNLPYQITDGARVLHGQIKPKRRSHDEVVLAKRKKAEAVAKRKEFFKARASTKTTVDNTLKLC